MKKFLTAATLTIAALILTSCAGTTTGDTNACITYQDGMNKVNAFVDDALKRDDKYAVQLEFDKLRAKFAQDLRATGQAAETPELTIELNRTARLILESADNDDAGVAFYLQRRTLVDLCERVGTKIDLDDYDE